MSDIEHSGQEPMPQRDEAQSRSGQTKPDQIKPALTTAQLAGGEADSTREVAAEPRSFAGHDEHEREAPLLAKDEVADLRERWTSIQAGFVDEPRRAVEDADALVAQTMKRLAEMFADERGKLEGQWDRGDQVGTEELRVALTRYRSFFDRLLSV